MVSTKTYRQLSGNGNTMLFATALSLILAIWLGMRPISGYYFGDTSNYARIYEIVKSMPPWNEEADGNEWVWLQLMYYCSRYMDVTGFFTVVSVGYFGFTLLACKILFRNNVYYALLFDFASISFYSYGVNGIRNGLACSLVLLCIAYATMPGKSKKILCAVTALLAVNIHTSTFLPVAALLASLFVVKNFRWSYCFWILSIALSLVAGNSISAFLANLGFDDRLSYLTNTHFAHQFSKLGFRWDFLLYSAMPIVLGYYVIVKKGIRDTAYMILLNTYILSNAFWVMVIRASFSNRFAYLSWFMYAIVLAYPLFKMDIWGKNQGKRASQIMLAHIGFTWFMQTFYW